MSHQAKPVADKRSKLRRGRYYHLKRFALAFVGLMVFLFVVRLWWGWEAHRRLQAEIDRIVARGEPLFPEDFNPPEEIPDDQNAAILYTKAAKSLNLTAEQDAFVKGINRPPEAEWTDEHWQIIASIAEASAEARELIRQARTMPGVDWGLRIKSPAINMLLPELGDQRQLARVLQLAAKHQYRTGDNAAAIETARDMLVLGDAVDEMPTLISHLVAIAIERLALFTFKEIFWELQIDGDPQHHAVGTVPADRSEIEKLVAALLDDAGMKIGLTRAMYSERMFQFDSAQIVAAGKLSFITQYDWIDDATPSTAERILAYPISPLIEMEAVWMLKHMEGVIEASSKPNWMEADQLVGPLEIKRRRALLMPQRVLKPLNAALLPSFNRAVQLHYQYLDERRQTAVALAVRLYELDHGWRPEKLADLVPDYLPEVPIAPLLEDDQRYTYGDLSINMLDLESESETADSKKAEGDDEQIENGQRQDDERGEGGADP